MSEENKICYQTFLPEPTPCFMMAGGNSCSEKDCLVEKVLNTVPSVYQSLIENLCHSVCRMSANSKNNQEFLDRTAKISNK